MHREHDHRPSWTIAVAAAASLIAAAGCGLPAGPEEPGEPGDNVGAVEQALDYNLTVGTTVGGSNYGRLNDPGTLVEIKAWSDSTNVYAFKLRFKESDGTYSGHIWGDTSHGSSSGFADSSGVVINKLEYYVDGASHLVGLRLTDNSTPPVTKSFGLLSSPLVAYSGTNCKLTDFAGWWGRVNMVNILWGAEFFWSCS